MSRRVTIQTPLGESLQFHQLVGREALSQLYTFDIDLLGSSNAIDSKALLGKAALPDELPWVTGSIGLIGTEPSWNLMRNCDTLLMIGSGFPYSNIFILDVAEERGELRSDDLRIDGVHAWPDETATEPGAKWAKAAKTSPRRMITWLPRSDGRRSGLNVTAFLKARNGSRSGWIHPRSAVPSAARTISPSNGA